MRLELWEREGKRKWEGRTAGHSIGNMSERTVLALVRSVLRTPR